MQKFIQTNSIRIYKRIEVAVPFGEAQAGFRIDPVVHGNQEYFREVHVTHARTTVAPFAGNRRLDAADRAVIIGVRFGYAVVHEGREVGHLVDGILFVRCLSADGHVLVERAARTAQGVQLAADFFDG